MFGTSTSHLKKGRVWKQASQYHWAFRAPAATGTMHLNLQSTSHRVLQAVWSPPWVKSPAEKHELPGTRWFGRSIVTHILILYLSDVQVYSGAERIQDGMTTPLPWLKYPLPLFPHSQITPISPSLLFQGNCCITVSCRHLCPSSNIRGAELGHRYKLQSQ